MDKEKIVSSNQYNSGYSSGVYAQKKSFEAYLNSETKIRDDKTREQFTNSQTWSRTWKLRWSYH